MLTRLQITLSIALAFACTAPSHAQTNVLDSDPLRARKLLIYDQYGAYAGLNLNSQGGVITTACNCEFTGGAATAYSMGVVFERLTRSRIFWGASLGIDNRSVEGRFREVEGVMQRAPSGQQEYLVPITFLNTANVGLTYLTFQPYAKLLFFNALFVRGGPTISYIISSSLKHTKELVDEQVRFPNGETAAVQLADGESRSVILQDGAYTGVSPLQVGLSLGTGLDLQLAKGFFFSPYVQYNLPFTSVAGQGAGFSVRAFQLLVECRWIL